MLSQAPGYWSFKENYLGLSRKEICNLKNFVLFEMNSHFGMAVNSHAKTVLPYLPLTEGVSARLKLFHFPLHQGSQMTQFCLWNVKRHILDSVDKCLLFFCFPDLSLTCIDHFLVIDFQCGYIKFWSTRDRKPIWDVIMKIRMSERKKYYDLVPESLLIIE